jgi:hypothetical protein
MTSASGGNGTGGTPPFDPSSLPPLPTDREFPHQVGPAEEYGYCTGEIHCGELLEGQCPALDNLWHNVPGYPEGSGSCTCTGGVLERSEEGPFRRDPELSPTDEPGPCCYVTYGISCDGRPLCAEGRLILAEVVVRSDWGSPRSRQS